MAALRVCGLSTRHPQPLQSVSFEVATEQLLVVAGEGDSGKEALLDAIDGHLPPCQLISGSIYFELPLPTPTGTSSVSHSKLLRLGSLVTTVRCNVPFTPGLTVRETLLVTAGIKLPTLSPQVRRVKVERLIESLNLTECADALVGGALNKGISSGEERRLAIACGLIGASPIILLHEPTSKLDSALAAHLFFLLAGIARHERKTIIVTVSHVTSQMMSVIGRIIILSAADGRLQFDGLAATLCEARHRVGTASLGMTGKLDELAASPIITPDTILTETAATKTSFRNNILHYYYFVDAKKCNFHRTMFSNPTIDTGITPAGIPDTAPADVDCTSAYDESPPAAKTCRRSRNLGCTRKHGVTFTSLFNRANIAVLRAPEVGLATLLIHLLLALLLGLLFLRTAIQTSSDGPNATPGEGGSSPVKTVSDVVRSTYPCAFEYDKCFSLPLQTPALWYDLFVFKFDGKDPLVHALENGVDGLGSQPLLSLFANKTLLSQFIFWLNCAGGSIDVNEHYKLLFNEDAHYEIATASVELNDQSDSKKLLSYPMAATAVKGALQLVDFIYLRLPWDKYAPNLNDTYFWEEITPLVAPYAVNPAFHCAGLPSLPGNQWLQSMRYTPFEPEDETFDPWDWRRRRLLTVGDDVKRQLIDELLLGFGPMMPAFADKISEIAIRGAACHQPWCHWWKRVQQQIGAGFVASGRIVGDTSNTLGALFIFVGSIPGACMHTLLSLGSMRAQLRSETDYYPLELAAAARLVAELPMLLIASGLSTALFCKLIGLHGPLILAALIGAGVSFAATGFAELLSAVCPTKETAVLALPIFVVLYMTLAGFLLRENDIPGWIAWLRYVDFLKWGFSGLVQAFFSQGALPRAGGLPARLVVIIAGNFDESADPCDALKWLLVIGVGFRAAACASLRCRFRSQRHFCYAIPLCKTA